MDFVVDHAVIFVSDLRAATKQFEALGFYVEAGGDHGYTENALIPFRDSTYIELIAVKSKPTQFLISCINKLGISEWQLRTRSNIMGRLIQWFSKPYGPIDWCLRDESNTEHNIPNSNSTKPREFSRDKPDNSTIKWTLSAPYNLNLPMLIQDITPHKYRAPEFREGIHKNGAHSIEEIILPKRDFVMVSELLKNSKTSSIRLGSTLLTPSSDSSYHFKFCLKISSTKSIQLNKMDEMPNWFIFS